MGGVQYRLSKDGGDDEAVVIDAQPQKPSASWKCFNGKPLASALPGDAAERFSRSDPEGRHWDDIAETTIDLIDAHRSDFRIGRIDQDQTRRMGLASDIPADSRIGRASMMIRQCVTSDEVTAILERGGATGTRAIPAVGWSRADS